MSAAPILLELVLYQVIHFLSLLDSHLNEGQDFLGGQWNAAKLLQNTNFALCIESYRE